MKKSNTLFTLFLLSRNFKLSYFVDKRNFDILIIINYLHLLFIIRIIFWYFSKGEDNTK